MFRRKWYKNLIERKKKEILEKIKEKVNPDEILRKVEKEEFEKKIKRLNLKIDYNEYIEVLENIKRRIKKKTKRKRKSYFIGYLKYYISGVRDTGESRKRRRRTRITLTGRIIHFLRVRKENLAFKVFEDFEVIERAIYDAMARLGLPQVDFRIDLIEVVECELIDRGYRGRLIYIIEKDHRTYDYSDDLTDEVLHELNS
ncbi:hypothetical protein [Methanocaldococcus sp.]